MSHLNSDLLPMNSSSFRTRIRTLCSSAYYFFITYKEEIMPFISIHKRKRLNFVNRNESRMESDGGSMEVLIVKVNKDGY